MKNAAQDRHAIKLPQPVAYCTATQAAEKWGESDPLTQVAAIVNFAKDRTIYFEGDEALCSYKVVSGTVRVCKISADGRRQIAAFHGSGDLFGWTDQDYYAYSAEAVTPVTLEKYPSRRVEELLAVNPETRVRLMKALAEQLAAAQEHLFMLGRMTAAERIVMLLIELAKKQQARTGGPLSLDLPMGRRDMADYLGLTIETVSRTLSALRRSGFISIPSIDQIRLNRYQDLEDLIEEPCLISRALDFTKMAAATHEPCQLATC